MAPARRAGGPSPRPGRLGGASAPARPRCSAAACSASTCRCSCCCRSRRCWRRSSHGGAGAFWREISSPEAVAAIKLTLIASAIVVAINAVFGTLIAWVLVRDEFPGKRVVNALIDLPFALPTIVAGVVLLALYGKSSPVGIDITFTRAAVVMALLFVTLPFVVRSVQPVLLELDRSMEEAAASLGAGR